MAQHDFRNFPELTDTQMDEFYFQSPHKQITENFRATVTKVIDGDTIKVKWDMRDFEFPVRLLNIAAAELKEKNGPESQSWLESKILDKEVDININPDNRVEKWGRLLGYVIFGGMDIGQESIIAGMSVPWEQRGEGQIPNFGKQLEKVIPKW